MQLQLATGNKELHLAEGSPAWTVIGSYEALHELVRSEQGARLLAPEQEELIVFVPLENDLTTPASESRFLAEIKSHPNLRVRLVPGVSAPLQGSSPETMFRLVAKELTECGLVT